ncbi:hypothetical protein M426DRAFT_318699 [Hypoxylon sp. CI-4A]|nr:hypothetical protein M426DRAFT_318699 [Hypoxylon sp. CI-4A]
MAPDAPKRRHGSGAFPGKFRTFVNDMKRFRIHRHERSRNEDPMLEPTPVPDSVPVPDKKAVSTLSPPSPPPDSLPDSESNLAVQVTITFDEPLNYSYTRNYEASPSLQATEALCQGLLRRVDHCCHELITRKDSTAMEYAAAASGPDKPLRFEIQIDIIRGWSEIWASRTFKSYQKQLLSAEAAREIIISTHQIIGLFLRRHDEGFVWKDGPVRDDPSEGQAKFPHRAGRVQPLSCVPRSYFLEKSQDFESIPGYTINFSFTSKCQRRKPSEWHKSVEVNSSQLAPLNSIGAEALFSEASYALEGVLRSERQAFEKTHDRCLSLDGCKDCRHHDSDGLELQFSITNNFGPQFPRLERTIRCNSNLSFYSDVQECLAFMSKVEAALKEVRDDADGKINQMNDLDFRIIELRGHGWTLDEPLVFVLDSTNSYSQRNIEALLDRVQTGVADTLRGNAISVRMTAHKRGHFILDKTFVSREPFELTEKKKSKVPRKSKAYVLGRLRQRVERGIATVCRDTLTFDDTEEETRNPENPASAPLVVEQRPLTRDAPSTSKIEPSGAETTESVSKDTTEREQQEESAYPRSESDTSAATSFSKGLAADYNAACAAANSGSVDDEAASPPSPGRPPIPARRSSAAVVSPDGSRAFPLVPGLDHYVESEAVVDEDSSDKNSPQTTSDEPTSDSSAQESSNTTSQDAAKATNKPERTEPVVMTGQGEPEPVSTYEPSIASSAPSLVSGGGSSPGSSLMITPKHHRYNSEADYPKNHIVDSDDEDGLVSLRIDTQHDLPKVQPIHSPTLRHATKPIPSSPLRVSQTAREPSDTNISESGGASLDNGISHDEMKTANPLPSIETEVAGHIELPNMSKTDKQGIPAPVDADDFAQSRQDFLFSSPPAITPESGNSEEEDNDLQRRGREASPDPSEDQDESGLSSPARHTLQTQRSSFGSAGMLGFHEQMFGSINMRSAFMRSRPGTSHVEDSSDAEEMPRPGTAI